MPARIDIHQLLSGQRRGPLATILRGTLACLEPLYASAAWGRNRLYDARWLASHDAGTPVISLGNLTAGGTGKTPLVGWLARHLLERGFRPAIISRGYRAQQRSGAGHAVNDEFLELQAALPDVPHVQDKDRVAAARAALDRFAPDVLVLDDGFQHRRLHRRLNIVLIDATCPFGYGHLLPRGLLRESLASLKRADLVWLTRVDQVDANALQAIADEVTRRAPGVPLAEVVFAPRRLIDAGGQEQPLESVQGKTVYGFCAIGNPAAFHRTLESMGVTLAGFDAFPDHHDFSKRELGELASRAQRAGAVQVLCTMKDIVKIAGPLESDVPVSAVVLESRFVRGQSEAEQRIDACLR